MGKNRIKKLRDITVEGKTYKWYVRHIDYYGPVLKVWENKNTVLYEGDVPDNNVTPSYVAEKIKEYSN
jgi:hypothetical protein